MPSNDHSFRESPVGASVTRKAFPRPPSPVRDSPGFYPTRKHLSFNSITRFLFSLSSPDTSRVTHDILVGHYFLAQRIRTLQSSRTPRRQPTFLSVEGLAVPRNAAPPSRKPIRKRVPWNDCPYVCVRVGSSLPFNENEFPSLKRLKDVSSPSKTMNYTFRPRKPRMRAPFFSSSPCRDTPFTSCRRISARDVVSRALPPPIIRPCGSSGNTRLPCFYYSESHAYICNLLVASYAG